MDLLTALNPPKSDNGTEETSIRLGWALPNYGPIFSQVYASHLAAIAHASREIACFKLGDLPMVGATDRMYVHNACNEIVRQAKECGLTHLFWTESDMILPYDCISRLAALEKDIAAGVYFLRGGSGQPCLYKKTPVETKENPYLHTPITVYDERAPFRVDCPGMGVVLMRMNVFDRIEEPYFDLKANDHGRKNGYGQDLYFYTKVRKAGIEVWVDPAVICDQIDTQIIGYESYRKRVTSDKQLGHQGGFIAGGGSEIESGGQSAT